MTCPGQFPDGLRQPKPEAPRALNKTHQKRETVVIFGVLGFKRLQDLPEALSKTAQKRETVDTFSV